MSFFYLFDPAHERDRRTAQGLLRLREKLAQELPPRTISDTLMLATWNIREFDSSKFGERTRESLSYIAEIISQFDLVAVQEVNADLEALKKVQKMLGDWWRFLVTDVTAGKKGNQERMAFLFDARKVKFGGLAGEIVIPPEKGAAQLARTPFICGFETGWLNFMLCTVHIYYAKARTARDKSNYYRQWRTFHLSDHLPMWLELPIDFGREYLERVAGTTP
jgi:hypothetical protein